MSYSDFSFFVKLGWSHIVSINALDHILFIMSLCRLSGKEKVMHWIYITLSFASGHTLAMTLGRFFHYPISIVEFLIPLTIIVSSVLSWLKRNEYEMSYSLLIMVLGFGVIHGLGFSGAFEMLSSSGSESISSALGFTLGLELSQILVLVSFLFLAKMLEKSGLLSIRIWNCLIFMMSLIGGIYLSISRWPF